MGLMAETTARTKSLGGKLGHSDQKEREAEARTIERREGYISVKCILAEEEKMRLMAEMIAWTKSLGGKLGHSDQKEREAETQTIERQEGYISVKCIFAGTRRSWGRHRRATTKGAK